MGHKLGQSKKGEISITPYNNDKSRLRFRYKGERYSLNVPIGEVKVIAAKIKLDIERGTFEINHYKKDKVTSGTLSELYTFWVTKYKNGNLQTNSNLSQVQSLITDRLPDISGESWSYTTYNRRLTTLSQFGSWLVKMGHITHNPYEGITKKSNPGKLPSTKRDPLTVQEINKLLTCIKGDQYGQYYYTFLYTLFRTGLRNEECIGLRVKYVDFERSLLLVREVLARGKTSNANKRIRKATKNNKVRDIPISEDLKGILQTHCIGKEPEDLVFTSPTGQAIDDRMLQKRILRRVFKECKIPYRDMYAARHSLATRALEGNMPITEVSLVLGNTVDTLVRHYVRPKIAPKELPNM